jgi:hypothetical protein
MSNVQIIEENSETARPVAESELDAMEARFIAEALEGGAE